MADNLDIISFRIIADASDSRDFAYQAFDEAKHGHQSECERFLAQSRSSLDKARRAQTDLLFEEMNGKNNTVNILLVHSQDHLSRAQTVLEMVERLIPMLQNERTISERLDQLERRVNDEN